MRCPLLQVCDSVLNIAPIANVTMGEPAFLSVSVTRPAALLHTVPLFTSLPRPSPSPAPLLGRGESAQHSR